MDKQNTNTMLHVNLLSLNVRGLNMEGKRRSVFQYIRKKCVDIAFLQETYSTKEIVNVWSNQWGGKIYFAHGTNHSKGVMILIRPGLDIKLQNCVVDLKGRYIMLDANLQGENIILLNVYAPNLEQEQISFYNELTHLLELHKHDNYKCIIGGDMNVIRNPSLDRKGGNFKPSNHYVTVIETIDNLLHANDLCDIWRIVNPDTRRYTWRQKKPSISSRLDIWFVSDILQDYCTDVDIKPSVRSDHSAITLSLKALANVRGKGYWKFNNSFLEENDFISGITQEYQKWLQEGEVFENIMMTWEYVKYKIREFSIRYGKVKAKNTADEIVENENTLKQLDEAIDREDNENVLHVLESERGEVEAKLKSIDDHKTQGLILRSRCSWYEKGEKSNSYFLRLVNRGKIKTTMNKLKNENGEEITDPKSILQMQARYYKELYSDKVQKY